MTALQITALVLVTLAGTAVVLTPEPLRQALVLAIYGLALSASRHPMSPCRRSS